MSFRQYPSYRSIGIEWLPEVPSHWTTSKLKSFATFIGGGTPSREVQHYWGGSIPWISPKDMKREGIDSSEEYITSAGLENSTTQLAPSGCLLIVVRSGILKHSIPVAVNKVEVALNQDLKALRLDPTKCSAAFALRWIQGLNGPLLLAWAKHGATVESIEYDHYTNTLIPLPPLPEQQCITDFLDSETAKIDALIAEQERLIELLKEKRQAVISEAVMKGVDPNAPTKKSGIEWLDLVPKHWKCVRLGTLFREMAEPGNAALPVLSVSIHDGVSDREYSEDELERKVTRSEDRSKYIRVRPDDLVYNMMRAWQGAFGTVRVEGMVSPAYVVARPRGELCTEFVEQLLRTPQAIEELRRHSHGVTDFRLRLYWDEFKSIRIALPPVEEQRAISEFFSRDVMNMDGLHVVAQNAIALLQERRSALISAAVTGQIDVRGLAEQKAA